MAHYMFQTEWVLTAPIERVFEVISQPEKYSEWWPEVRESRLLDLGDADGVGRTASYSVRSPFGYTMHFELKAIDVQAPNRVSALVRGDLVGTGTHYLETRPEGTLVRLDWYVSTTKPWMNIVAKFAKPLLSWSHRHVMYEGCASMAAHLGARLLGAETKLVDSDMPVVLVEG